MMATKKKGLGRGLNALLGGTESVEAMTTVQHEDELRELAIDLIRRGPWQPRTHFDEESLQELADANCGYLSWLFSRMLGDPGNERLEIGRFENLQDDFLSIMARLDVAQADAMRTAFDNQVRANVSRHTHYS